uniref:Pept_C1 domain-containing protein n=1 Tax=Panagrellus redivivus TaxID=6233 RepID=A0A7E4VS99_PANRE
MHDENMRFENLRENLKHIRNLNEQNTTAKFGLTPFAAMNLTEMRKRLMPVNYVPDRDLDLASPPATTVGTSDDVGPYGGSVFDVSLFNKLESWFVRFGFAPRSSGYSPTASQPETTTVPSTTTETVQTTVPMNDTVDYRTKGVISAVKNQGSCSSCYAFAVTGMLEALNLQAATPRNLSLSEQQLVSCDSGSDQCAGGRVASSLRYVIANGVVSETTIPYTGENSSTCPTTDSSLAETYNLNSAEYFKATSWTYLEASETAIETHVRSTGPVIIWLELPLELMYYTGGVFEFPNCTANAIGTHFALVVGFTEEAWIVKNSFGTAWGDMGYFYLKRGANVCSMASYPVVVTL